MTVENLDNFEKDLLLRWFLHYMPMGSGTDADPTKATRTAFMREYPAIYNKLAGREIARVMHVSSNTPA